MSVEGDLSPASGPRVVAYLRAFSARFLPLVAIIAIARQKAYKRFQKHVLLFATFLLNGAIVSNVLISFYVAEVGPVGRTGPEGWHRPFEARPGHL